MCNLLFLVKNINHRIKAQALPSFFFSFLFFFFYFFFIFFIFFISWMSRLKPLLVRPKKKKEKSILNPIVLECNILNYIVSKELN